MARNAMVFDLTESVWLAIIQCKVFFERGRIAPNIIVQIWMCLPHTFRGEFVNNQPTKRLRINRDSQK
jgi:hypothetical protein